MLLEPLYHYYDESTGPFVNLSDLTRGEAEKVLSDARANNRGFASKRSADYMQIRYELELKARELFLLKGGKPIRMHPHYMTFGKCPWLLEWYPTGRELQIPIHAFDPDCISFTYGDLFPTMRFQDGKPYRNQIFTKDEIYQVIAKFGLPQEWNSEGSNGPERYIEVQIWDDKPLREWSGSK